MRQKPEYGHRADFFDREVNHRSLFSCASAPHDGLLASHLGYSLSDRLDSRLPPSTLSLVQVLNGPRPPPKNLIETATKEPATFSCENCFLPSPVSPADPGSYQRLVRIILKSPQDACHLGWLHA